MVMFFCLWKCGRLSSLEVTVDRIGKRHFFLCNLTIGIIPVRRKKVKKASMTWSIIIIFCPLFFWALIGYWMPLSEVDEAVEQSDSDIELRLATAKAGDVLAFRDGRSCQVLQDRIFGNSDIQYVCSNEPLAVLSTPVQSLAPQLGRPPQPSQAGILDWLTMPWGKEIPVVRF
jgi:hypothetical protein